MSAAGGAPPGALESSERSSRTVSRLGQLLSVLLRPAPTREELLDEVLWMLAEMFTADVVALADADPLAASIDIQASVGMVGPVGRLPGADLIMEAVRTGEPLAVRSLRTDGWPAEGVAIPLGEGCGVLFLGRGQGEPFDSGDVDLLCVMGRHISAVLAQGRRMDRLALLGEHAPALARSTVEEVSAAVVRIARDLFDADASALMQISGTTAVMQAQVGLEVGSGWSRPVEQLSGYCALLEQRPAVFSDIAARSPHPATRAGTLRGAVVAPVEVDAVTEYLLYVFRRSSVAFGPDDGHLLSLLGTHFSAALVNARLLVEAQRQGQLAELLRQHAESLTGSARPEEVLSRCLATMASVAGADRATALVVDGSFTHLRPAASHGAGAEEFLARLVQAAPRMAIRDTKSIALALRTREPVSWSQQRMSPSGPGSIYRRSTDMARVMILPLVAGDEAAGVVLLEWASGDAPVAHPDADTVLDQVAASTAVALQRAALFDRTRSDREQLRALHDVSVAISSTDSLPDVLHSVVDAAVTLTGAAAARIELLGEDASTTVIAASTGPSRVPVGARLPIGVGLSGWAIRRGKSVWMPDIAAGVAEPPSAAGQQRSERPGSVICVPLRGRHDRIRGALTLRADQPYFFSRSALDLTERLAAEAAIAVDRADDLAARASLEQRLRKQAYEDQLTGLPNRAMLTELLSKATAGAGPSSLAGVLYLDLDRFKAVNDTLGHAAGDGLLVAFVERLRSALRPRDTIARLGGDEFVVLLGELSSPADACAVAERILAALSDPVRVQGAEIHVSSSIGVATEEGITDGGQRLLRQADIAMYQAKSAGRGRYAVYAPSMGQQAARRVLLETELRQALADHALEVHYQPIIDLRSGVVRGFEALSRWPHPTRGHIPPDEFIPAAEESGLVEALDARALDVALSDIKELQRRWGRPDLRLNVNVSASQLRHARFAHRIAAALQGAGFPPSQLAIEVTETAAVDQGHYAGTTLQRVRELGVEIHLDDFGTGYSNLGYLKRLPIDGLKIDRSFVSNLHDPRDAAIVECITALGVAFGLDVTAEGVETVEQAERLAESGCLAAQGYLYSPAVPAAQLVEFPCRFSEGTRCL